MSKIENKKKLLKRTETELLGFESEKKRILEKHAEELAKFDENLELVKLQLEAIKKI